MDDTKAGSQKDPGTTAKLFELAVSTEDQEEFDNTVEILQHRCGKEVTDSARFLCHSEMAHERAVGAYVLSRNSKECVRSGETSIDQVPDMIAFLSNMLGDGDSEVLEAVLLGLGTLDPSWGYMGAETGGKDTQISRSLVKSIPGILRLADHDEACVRQAVAHALSSLGTSAMPQRLRHSMESALVKFTTDENVDVRKEAVLSLTSVDQWPPEVRQALYNRLDDEDEDIRALVLDALAERREPGTVDLLIREISMQTVINPIFVLEAAE